MRLLPLLLLSACAGIGSPIVTYGASVPLMEFAKGQTNPAQFAPGAGIMGTVGLFQVPISGKQFDLLDLGGSFFEDVLVGNAPAASTQVALTVGTLNNLVFAGAALPLAGGATGGLGNGVFEVYPVIGFNIPLSFGQTSPPVGIAQGVQGFPRGGTLELP